MTPARLDDLGAMERALSVFARLDQRSYRLLPKHIQCPGDAAMIAAFSHSLGRDVAWGLRNMHLIEGKPSLSADAMAALAIGHPDCEYLLPEEVSPERAVYVARRRGWPDGKESRFTFSMEDAARAGLSGRGTWAKYPAAMLKARCLAMACRAVFPDAISGAYVEGELDEVEPARRMSVDARPADDMPTRATVVEDAEVVEGEPTSPDLDALRAFYAASPASVRPDLRGCNDAMAAQLVRQFIADHPDAFARWQAGDAPFPEPTTTPARVAGPKTRVRDALVAADIDPDTLAALAEAWGGGLDSLARYLSDGALAEPVAAVLDAAASAGDQGEAIDAVASGVATFGVDSMGCAPFVDCIDAQRWRRLGGLLDEVVRRWYDAQRARDEAAR